MTAEAIAKVVADLKAGRQRPTLHKEHPEGQRVADYAATLGGPTVDASSIYKVLVTSGKPVRTYEDHPCVAPPWDNAYIGYVNDYGNVILIVMTAQSLAAFLDDDRYAVEQIEEARHLTQPEPWKPDQPVEWDRVKWVVSGFVWVGGFSQTGGRPLPTIGPMHLWQCAVYPDGEPADIHWVQLRTDIGIEAWDNAGLVMLGSLNFLNCRNVQIVEPQRPRAEARRIARTGVSVHTINIFPVSRRSSSKSQPTGEGVPLTPVRGSFHHHGACCSYHPPRGLLFGKYEGRFWVPMHARGRAELGESKSDYRLVADGNE